MANLFSTGPGAGERGQNVASLLGNPQPQDLLTVHDINVSRQPRFQPGGGIVNDYVVRYFIGPHGPFVHEYDPSVYSPAQVQADIEAEAQSLQAIALGPTQVFGGSCPGQSGSFQMRQLSHSGADVGSAPSMQSVINWFGRQNPNFSYQPFNPSVALRPGQWSVVQNPDLGTGVTTYSVEWANWSGQAGMNLNPPPGGQFPS